MFKLTMNANILEIIRQPDCPDILEFNPIIVITKCGLHAAFSLVVAKNGRKKLVLECPFAWL